MINIKPHNMEEDPWSSSNKKYAISKDKYSTLTRELLEEDFFREEVTIRSREDFMNISQDILIHNKTSYDVAVNCNLDYYTIKKLIIL